MSPAESPNELSTRELALIIWLVVAVIAALTNGKIRKSLFKLVHAFVQKKILIVVFSALLYTVAVVYILSKVRIWNPNLIKDTVVWFLGTAFILALNTNKGVTDSTFFRTIIKENLALVVALEFFLNYFTFALWIELPILPMLALLGGLSAVAESEPSQQQVKRIIDAVLSMFGIVLVAFMIWRIAGNYRELATMDNLRSLLLPPLLTITYLPFVYLFALLMAYENLFLRIDFLLRDNDALAKKAKHGIVTGCHISLRKLVRFSKHYAMALMSIKSSHDMRVLFERFRSHLPAFPEEVHETA